jgi:hypothetical protein
MSTEPFRQAPDCGAREDQTEHGDACALHIEPVAPQPSDLIVTKKRIGLLVDLSTAIFGKTRPGRGDVSGGRIQHVPDLSEQRRRGEGLVEEGYVRVEH